MAKLTPKKLAFIDEYLVDLNATQAAIRAGYSDKTAYSMGQRLLKDVEVAAQIEQRQAQRAKRTELDADRVILELARLGLHDVRRLFDDHGRMKAINDLDDDTAAAVQSIEVVTRELPRQKGDPVEVEYVHKVKLADKIKPLELIGRHLGKRLGQWSDRTEHDIPRDSPLASLVDAINGGKSTLQPSDDNA